MSNNPTAVKSPLYIAMLTLLTALLMLIDGYDLQVMALVAAPISEGWGVPVSDFGIVHSAAVAGLGLGAVVIGSLGDRYGRRNIILISFALITFAVAACGFTSTITELMFWRFLTGVGLGAMLANAAALLAEFLPDNRRSLLLTLASSGIPLGAIGSGLLVPQLLANYDWHGAFWASSIISAVIWVALFFCLPEAPSYKHRQQSPKSLQTEAKPGFFSVLQPEHRLSTLALWALFVGNAFLIYIMVSWIPVLMTQQGWDITHASAVIVYFQAGGLAGGVIVATMMDRWSPYKALLAAYALTGLCLIGFAVIPDQPLFWGALFALVGAGISGVHMTINAMAAVVYPVTILSSAIGFTVAVARIGAIAAPLVGGVLIAQKVGVEKFMLWQLVPLLFCAGSVLTLAWLQKRSLLAQL